MAAEVMAAAKVEEKEGGARAEVLEAAETAVVKGGRQPVHPRSSALYARHSRLRRSSFCGCHPEPRQTSPLQNYVHTTPTPKRIQHRDHTLSSRLLAAHFAYTNDLHAQCKRRAQMSNSSPADSLCEEKT